MRAYVIGFVIGLAILAFLPAYAWLLVVGYMLGYSTRGLLAHLLHEKMRRIGGEDARRLFEKMREADRGERPL